MTSSGVGQVTLGRLLADAAVVGVLGPGLLLLAGYSWQRAYFTSLGLADPAAISDPGMLMVRGFWLVLGPIAATALVYLLVWVVFSVQERRALEHTSPTELPLLAWAAAGSLFAAVMALILIKETSMSVFLGYSIFDLLVMVVMLPIMAILIVMSLRKGRISQLFFGRTLSGIVFLAIVLVSSVAAHAQFSGWGDANDLSWGCIDRPAAIFQAEGTGTSNNTTYVVLAHVGGFLYVRDAALPGDKREALAVPESKISTAMYFYLPAEDCD